MAIGELNMKKYHSLDKQLKTSMSFSYCHTMTTNNYPYSRFCDALDVRQFVLHDIGSLFYYNTYRLFKAFSFGATLRWNFTRHPRGIPIIISIYDGRVEFQFVF